MTTSTTFEMDAENVLEALDRSADLRAAYQVYF